MISKPGMNNIRPIAINKFAPGQCVILNKTDMNKLNVPTIIKIIENIFKSSIIKSINSIFYLSRSLEITICCISEVPS